jgi:hypothetical protein
MGDFTAGCGHVVDEVVRWLRDFDAPLKLIFFYMVKSSIGNEGTLQENINIG